ncbi:hypothetical protein HY990_05835 [Candidatus Micrarchaeota archaeon]|nr:hypothetical protein [Candidatus Micrarchaeota archaeon]
MIFPLIFQLATQADQTAADIADFRARFNVPPPNFRFYDQNDLRSIVQYLRRRGASDISASEIRILPAQAVAASRLAVRGSFTLPHDSVRLLDSVQPLVLVIPQRHLNRLNQLSDQDTQLGMTTRGLHLSNNNLCLLGADDYASSARVHLERHEIGHFYDDLLSGDSRLLITDIYGADYVIPKRSWVTEGLNEWGTARALNEVRYYKYETLAITLLEHLVGAASIRSARTTGDFREVQGLVDRIGGVGLFEQFIGSENGAEAYLTLRRGVLGRSGFNSVAFENDPLVASLLTMNQPLARPLVPHRSRFEYTDVAQESESIETESAQHALDEALGSYAPSLRNQFTPSDRSRILTQANREMTQLGDFVLAVAVALPKIRPDLAIEQEILDWSSEDAPLLGPLSASELSRLRDLVRLTPNVTVSQNNARYEQAMEVVLNIRTRRTEDLRLTHVSNVISGYCNQNQVEPPPQAELRSLGRRLLERDHNLTLDELTDLSLEEFRFTYPVLAITAESNRFARNGIFATTVILDGEELVRDPRRGRQIYEREMAHLTGGARSVICGSRESAQLNNVNPIPSSNAPLYCAELIGSSIYARLLGGDVLTAQNLIVYYQRDLRAIVVERPSDHASVAFFEEGNQISEARGFRNLPLIRGQSNPAITSDEMLDLLTNAYRLGFISDLALRRLQIWDNISVRLGRN